MSHNPGKANSTAAKGLVFAHESAKENTRLTEKGQHEDPIVAHSKLIAIAEVVSDGEFVILTWTQMHKCENKSPPKNKEHTTVIQNLKKKKKKSRETYPWYHLHCGRSHGGCFGLLRFIVCGQRGGDAVRRRHGEVTTETSLC